MAKTYIGIEIGNYRMKMAVCINEKLKQFISAELPENMVREGQIVSWESMADFIKEQLKEHHLQGKITAIVLPDGLTYIRRVEMPAMTVSQLKVNLPYEFHDFIADDKEKYFYDYAVDEMITDEAGVPKVMDLLTVAVKKSVIEQYRTMLRRAGLRLGLAAPEIAAYENIIRRHAALEGETEAAVPDYGILDLGYVSVKLHIFTKGKYEITRSIEPGLEAMTEIVAETFGVDHHIAEVYKQKNHENVWENEGCTALYNRIAIELMRVLNFYSFNNPDNTLDRIYYCGGGAMITPLLEEITSVIEPELEGMDALFPPETGEKEALLAGPAAIGIAWE